MGEISKERLQRLRDDYPPGTRIRLLHMEDPYMGHLHPGSTGTVVCVDDIGTIHTAWDEGSSLGIAYGVDQCEKIIKGE